MAGINGLRRIMIIQNRHFAIEIDTDIVGTGTVMPEARIL
jgi:hypothetical protein